MIIIATDSTAYLTRQEAKDLSVVHIPMTYTVDDEEYAETFHKMDARFERAAKASKAGKIHTSQPTLGAFLRRFERLVDVGCEVLVLTISQRLSGTYNNAVECARDYGDKIRVVDTRLTAAGMYLMVKEAKRLIDGGAALSEVEQAMRAYRDQVHTRFSVADLAPLRRSGRLGLVRQSVGTILNQRPILSLAGGQVVCVDTARGRNDQLRKLAESVPEGAETVMVQYCADQEGAQALAQRLTQRLGRPVPIRNIGVVLGAHLGFDVVGVVWAQPQER